MDHDARVRVEVALGVVAALAPVVATLLGLRLGPFRRLRAGDADSGRLRGRWPIVALGILPPVVDAAALLVDVRLTNATGSYVIDPFGMLSMWMLAVTGPWFAAGFVAGGRHSREAIGVAPDSSMTARVRGQLALGAAMSAWSVYGPYTVVVAFGIGLSMSDANNDVIVAAIHRTFLSTGIACTVVSLLGVAAAWRATRSTATTVAIAAMPATIAIAGAAKALLP